VTDKQKFDREKETGPDAATSRAKDQLTMLSIPQDRGICKGENF